MSSQDKTVGQIADEKINQASDAASNAADKANEASKAMGETKDNMVEGAKEMGNDAKKTGEDLADKAQDKFSDGRGTVGEKVEEAGGKIKGEETFTEKVGNAFNSAYDSAAQMTSNAAEAIGLKEKDPSLLDKAENKVEEMKPEKKEEGVLEKAANYTAETYESAKDAVANTLGQKENAK